MNATIFAYGQTSSGKTFTINSIIDMALRQIFKTIDTKREERQYLVRMSALEIYNESVQDMLGTDESLVRHTPNRGQEASLRQDQTV